MTAPLVDLAGRHAVVTGAAGGLGRATALMLAAVGARVSALDIDSGGAVATAAQIREAGGEADAITCDVADGGSVAAAFQRDAPSGAPDILGDNARANPRLPGLEITAHVCAQTLAIT